MKNTNQKGFTLIELMISLFLGLLVGAATIQMLMISQRTLLLQQASSSIQDNAIFGVDAMSRSIRLAGFGSRDSKANPSSPQGAIVISTDKSDTNTTTTNLEKVRLSNLTGYIPKTVVSCSENMASVTDSDDIFCDNAVSSGAGWSGASNLSNQKSDQLVIQYRMPVNGFDCEGVAVNKGIMVVERYFLRKDDDKQPNEVSPLALACDAGHYDDSDEIAYAADKIQMISTADGGNDFPEAKGEILVNRVDHFAFQLGVTQTLGGIENVVESADDNRIAYYSLSDYLNLGANPPRITHIRFALVTRSLLPAKSAKKENEQRFNVLDKTDLKLASAGQTPYMRKVYSNTILLRSARS